MFEVYDLVAISRVWDHDIGALDRNQSVCLSQRKSKGCPMGPLVWAPAFFGGIEVGAPFSQVVENGAITRFLT